MLVSSSCFFHLVFFDRVTALFNLKVPLAKLVSRTMATSLVGVFCRFADFFAIIQTCACAFWISFEPLLTELRLFSIHLKLVYIFH